MRVGVVLAVVLVTTLIGMNRTHASTALAGAFSAASAEFGVPAVVLQAVAYAESRWEDHAGKPSFANGFGVMHLQDNPHNRGLREAAAALGSTPAVLRSSTLENVRGGALLLRLDYERAYASDRGLRGANEIGRWYVPVARYLRSEHLQPQRDFADRVYTLIARGAARTLNGSRFEMAAMPGVRPDLGPYDGVMSDAENARTRRAGVTGSGKAAAPLMSWPEGGGDQWYGSPNFWSGRFGYALTGVVIHTCESGVQRCLDELTNPSTYKSAHYVVRSSDGWRFQLVHRWDTAWQCGYCTQSPFGNQWNPQTIGIEHEGWSSDPSWYTSTMYSRSAWLTARACVDYGFACAHGNRVYGHDYAQPGNSDPGPWWNWSWYMTCVSERVEFLRTGTWPPGTQCW